MLFNSALVAAAAFSGALASSDSKPLRVAIPGLVFAGMPNTKPVIACGSKLPQDVQCNSTGVRIYRDKHIDYCEVPSCIVDRKTKTGIASIEVLDCQLMAVNDSYIPLTSVAYGRGQDFFDFFFAYGLVDFYSPDWDDMASNNKVDLWEFGRWADMPAGFLATLRTLERMPEGRIILAAARQRWILSHILNEPLSGYSVQKLMEKIMAREFNEYMLAENGLKRPSSVHCGSKMGVPEREL